MAKFSFDQMMQHTSGGGSSFFSLKANEEARVRFLYDTFADIEGYTVHEFNKNNNYATIVCGRHEGDSKEACKWCMMDNKPVNRVIVPVYNEDKGEVQYWKRSEQWVKENLLPQIEVVVKEGFTICSQVYIVKRVGNGLDTTYPLIRTGMPNNKRKAEYGEIKDPFAINMIKPVDYEFDPYAGIDNVAQQNTANTYGNNFGQVPPATRRTADVF